MCSSYVWYFFLRVWISQELMPKKREVSFTDSAPIFLYTLPDGDIWTRLGNISYLYQNLQKHPSKVGSNIHLPKEKTESQTCSVACCFEQSQIMVDWDSLNSNPGTITIVVTGSLVVSVDNSRTLPGHPFSSYSCMLCWTCPVVDANFCHLWILSHIASVKWVGIQKAQCPDRDKLVGDCFSCLFLKLVCGALAGQSGDSNTYRQNFLNTEESSELSGNFLNTECPVVRCQAWQVWLFLSWWREEGRGLSLL